MIEFGKRNAPPRPKTGHEALPTPLLTAQVVHDTVHGIHDGEFHNNLAVAIKSSPDIRARANEITALVEQGRVVNTESLRALTDAVTQYRPKKD